MVFLPKNAVLAIFSANLCRFVADLVRMAARPCQLQPITLSGSAKQPKEHS